MNFCEKEKQTKQKSSTFRALVRFGNSAVIVFDIFVGSFVLHLTHIHFRLSCAVAAVVVVV